MHSARGSILCPYAADSIEALTPASVTPPWLPPHPLTTNTTPLVFSLPRGTQNLLEGTGRLSCSHWVHRHAFPKLYPLCLPLQPPLVNLDTKTASSHESFTYSWNIHLEYFHSSRVYNSIVSSSNLSLLTAHHHRHLILSSESSITTHDSCFNRRKFDMNWYELSFF